MTILSTRIQNAHISPSSLFKLYPNKHIFMLTCGNRSLSCSFSSSWCCSYTAATELHSWSWCIGLGSALISRTTTGHTGLPGTTIAMWRIWGGEMRKQTGLRWGGETLAVDGGAWIWQWAWTTITELVEPLEQKWALLDSIQSSFFTGEVCNL